MLRRRLKKKLVALLQFARAPLVTIKNAVESNTDTAGDFQISIWLVDQNTLLPQKCSGQIRKKNYWAIKSFSSVNEIITSATLSELLVDKTKFHRGMYLTFQWLTSIPVKIFFALLDKRIGVWTLLNRLRSCAHARVIRLRNCCIITKNRVSKSLVFTAVTRWNSVKPPTLR